eukprot:TRINITY_DN1966_c0_g1_i2.p2 TRINITY_DN1966_c0_g1~~TRINITY_DN1966_c0_g1_i2.p2  ORF type:complete len:135 (-),score=0.99 TRINITY_DN1966_c0_g1_i2:190-594(-)
MYIDMGFVKLRLQLRGLDCYLIFPGEMIRQFPFFFPSPGMNATRSDFINQTISQIVFIFVGSQISILIKFVLDRFFYKIFTGTLEFFFGRDFVEIIRYFTKPLFQKLIRQLYSHSSQKIHRQFKKYLYQKKNWD